jgi:hypothetical protein
MPYIPNHEYDMMCQEEVGHDTELKLEIERLKARIAAMEAIMDRMIDRLLNKESK